MAFVARGRFRVVSLCAFLFSFSQFFRLTNAILAPDLARDLGLSATDLGFMSAVFFYVFAVAQIPLGFFLDRTGPRKTMTVLNLVGAAGAVVFATAGSVSAAVLGRALLGVGMAGNLMGTMKVVTRWFSPREFMTVSGLVLAFGSLGNIVASTPLAVAAEFLGWRWCIGGLGVITAALSVLFFVGVRDAPPEAASPRPVTPACAPPRPRAISETARLMLSSRQFWLISGGTFFRYGTFVAIQALWAGPYLMEVTGLTPVETGNLLAAINIGYVVGSPLGGWLSDRVFRERKWLIVLGIAVFVAAELPFVTGVGVAYGWLFWCDLLLLGTFSAFGSVMFAHIKESMPKDITGTAMTWVNFFTMMGGAAFLHGMGRVLDHWLAAGWTRPEAYRAAFLCAFAGGVVSLVLYLFTKDTGERAPAPAPRTPPEKPGRPGCRH